MRLNTFLFNYLITNLSDVLLQIPGKFQILFNLIQLTNCKLKEHKHIQDPDNLRRISLLLKKVAVGW